MTNPSDKVDMDKIAFRLREGFHRFAAEGHGIVIEAGQTFETADTELHKLLDRQPALERVPAEPVDAPVEVKS